MPDHVHVILTPGTGYDLQRILKGIKGTTARQINMARGSRGSLWMEEGMDRVIRANNELDEKLRYMLNNPAKEALAEDGWKYEWRHYDSSYLTSDGV